MPLATSSPRVMPPKMLMKMACTAGSLLMTSSAPAMTSALAPPPMSRKLAGDAAHLVDHVQGAHGQPGAVGDDADGAVQADVLQALLVGGLLAVVTLLGRLVLGPLVAEVGVGVQGHLGVQGVDLAGGLEDERVDLHQVGVAVDVGPVELEQDVDRAVGGGGVQLGGLHPGPGRGLVQAVDRVDPDLGDGVGVLLRHGLDLDATLGGQHAQVLLGRAVQREAGVVLLGDVGGHLDPHHLDGVALDVHARGCSRRARAPRRCSRPA